MQGTLDGGLSWLVVFGSFMSQFVVMGIHFVFGLLYIDLLKEFGQSKATTGENELQRTGAPTPSPGHFLREKPWGRGCWGPRVQYPP